MRLPYATVFLFQTMIICFILTWLLGSLTIVKDLDIKAKSCTVLCIFSNKQLKRNNTRMLANGVNWIVKTRALNISKNV